MKTKYYIYRIVNHNGRKEYKRTKTSDFWSGTPEGCWQYTWEGATQIVARENKWQYEHNKYYTYGKESVKEATV